MPKMNFLQRQVDEALRVLYNEVVCLRKRYHKSPGRDRDFFRHFHKETAKALQRGS